MPRYYTPEHVWIETERAADTDGGGLATVGITAHAQDALGDIVFADLPALGRALAAGEAACVIESVKTAADVFCPASGSVAAVNDALRADPALLNTDPLGAGWLFKLTLAQPAELAALLDEAAYAALLPAQG